MSILVTGSSGHLGEALMRTLREAGREAVGLDVLESPFTDVLGSVAERRLVDEVMVGVDTVIHAATLHKPHVATHTRQDFVDTNVTGTLHLLEAAVAAGVGCFVFTSTTSVFGRALTPPPGEPAAWVTESLAPIPRNIYGVTKAAAEGLCELFHRDHGLPCAVLRTSRFFPEEDDRAEVRRSYTNDNLKVNEFLNRRVEIEDVVSAHLLALERAPALGFARYIISATTPFTPEDLLSLRDDPAAVVRRHVPQYETEYARRGWTLFPDIERVYVNERARNELGWRPRYDFAYVIDRLRAGEEPRSRLARSIGAKGYHAGAPALGQYPFPDRD